MIDKYGIRISFQRLFCKYSILYVQRCEMNVFRAFGEAPLSADALTIDLSARR